MVFASLQISRTETSPHYSFEKNLIERTIQYIKDRTGSFDDYFPCNKKAGCDLDHTKNWLYLLINMHNKGVINAKVARAMGYQKIFIY